MGGMGPDGRDEGAGEGKGDKGREEGFPKSPPLKILDPPLQIPTAVREADSLHSFKQSSASSKLCFSLLTNYMFYVFCKLL